MIFESNRSVFLRPRERLFELLLLQDADRAGGLLSTDSGDTAFDPRTLAGYLADLERRHLLKRTEESGGRAQHRLTVAGRKRLNHLLVDYIRELRQLNDGACEIIRRRLFELCLAGVQRIAFYPFSETAEVAFSVLPSLDLELVGVVDDSPQKWGLRFHHMLVRPPAELETLMPDAVVVTTALFQDRIVAKLAEMQLGNVRVHTL